MHDDKLMEKVFENIFVNIEEIKALMKKEVPETDIEPKIMIIDGKPAKVF